MEISIIPLGTVNASVSSHVAESLRVLEGEKGINYELHPMGTIIEADSLNTLFEIAKKMHEAVLYSDVKRVVTSIKIDDRKDKKLTMSGKIKSVENKLNKEKNESGGQ